MSGLGQDIFAINALQKCLTSQTRNDIVAVYVRQVNCFQYVLLADISAVAINFDSHRRKITYIFHKSRLSIPLLYRYQCDTMNEGSGAGPTASS